MKALVKTAAQPDWAAGMDYKIPIVLGHEFSGRVVKLGDG